MANILFMDTSLIIEKYGLQQGEQWTYKGFHAVLHTFFPLGDMMITPLKEYFGDGFSLTVFFMENDYCHWYWRDTDMERIRKEFIRRVDGRPEFLGDLVTEWQRRLQRFEEVFAPINPDLLAQLSNEDLYSRYCEFIKAYKDSFSIAIGFQDPFSMHADRFLEPELKAGLPTDRAHELFVLLTAPVNESFINQELRDRCMLLKKLQSNEVVWGSLVGEPNQDVISKLQSEFPDLYRALDAHVQKYHWIHNNYAKTPYLNHEFFITELQNMLSQGVDPDRELQENEQHLRDTRTRKAEAITELRLSGHLLNLVNITETFAYMQDERKKYVLLSNYYQKLFRNEVGKRTGLSESEMDYVVIDEIPRLFNGTIDRSEVMKRKVFSLCIHSAESYDIVTGPVAREVHAFVTGEVTLKQKTLKGQVASLGKVSGPVKIVHKVHDLANMQEGDILVATMTRPEMVVAIQKAAAIVTDEGGITSHAAIVAREFNIPAVIGTKIATKVLRDGDIVEVDATRGVVRKLPT